MSRRIRSLVIFTAGVLVILSLSSCLDPDKERPMRHVTPTLSTYQDLTQKDHVLNNLELAYNGMNLTRYAELLDDPNFIFFFSDEDYAEGKTPEQWGRDDDLACQEKMFDPDNPVHKVLSVKLTLQYPAGSWNAITPDPGQFPDETWYYKSVNYNLTVVVEAPQWDITYLAQNLKALFTVRQVEKNGKQIWQIVEWRDDVYTTASGAKLSDEAAATQETSWGSVKSLFH